MKVVITGPNMNTAAQKKGANHVHADGCGDLKHYGPGTKFGGELTTTIEASSELDVMGWLYGDHLGDHGLTVDDAEGQEMLEEWMSDVFFAPCVKFTSAPKGAERSTMESTTPTAESLMEGLGEAVSPDKAPYSRLRVEGRTLAYADRRKDGFVLSFATSALEGLPKKFTAGMDARRGRTTMHVTAKNIKTARALLEWLAKHQEGR